MQRLGNLDIYAIEPDTIEEQAESGTSPRTGINLAEELNSMGVQKILKSASSEHLKVAILGISGNALQYAHDRVQGQPWILPGKEAVQTLTQVFVCAREPLNKPPRNVVSLNHPQR